MKTIRLEMNNLIKELHALDLENLKLSHRIEINWLKKSLELEYDSKIDEIKREYIEKQEFDLSGLQNKVDKLQ